MFRMRGSCSQKLCPLKARAINIEQFRAALLDDPESSIIKFVDGGSGNILAFALWVFHEIEDSQTNDPEWKRSWDEGTNEEAADALGMVIVTKKQQLIAGRPHCCGGSDFPLLLWGGLAWQT